MTSHHRTLFPLSVLCTPQARFVRTTKEICFSLDQTFYLLTWKIQKINTSFFQYMLLHKSNRVITLKENPKCSLLDGGLRPHGQLNTSKSLLSIHHNQSGKVHKISRLEQNTCLGSLHLPLNCLSRFCHA